MGEYGKYVLPATEDERGENRRLEDATMKKEKRKLGKKKKESSRDVKLLQLVLAGVESSSQVRSGQGLSQKRGGRNGWSHAAVQLRRGERPA